MESTNNNINNILQRLEIVQLNEIQQAMLKTCKSVDNIVLLSPTGTGKTLAFLLPLLEQLKSAKELGVQALILTPSRELALQITAVFSSMQTGFKVSCCYGGHPIHIELQNLQEAPSLLIGTPGRIVDHLRRQSFDTENITTLVLDEFDKSLELGFSEDMSFIINHLVVLRKRILTSATSNVKVPDFVGLEKPVFLNFINEMETGQLDVKELVCPEDEKDEYLFRLISLVGNEPTLIFCNHRAIVEEVSALLNKFGVIHDIFHGGLEQNNREVALVKFKNGSNNILVVTDLAARGLDITTIRNIIHFQLPHTESEYIHRNGRTARMHASGTAYLMSTENKPKREYLQKEFEQFQLPENISPLALPEWETIYVSAGKKDKVNKIDIVGTFLQKGNLQKEDIGLILVKEHASFIAVKKDKAAQVIKLLNKEQIKKKRVAVDYAR